jgi:predicted transposase YbfD/YdcC
MTAFAVDTAPVLAHIEIDEKSYEIPAVQKLLEELDVAGKIVTLDTMHCQKKIRNGCGRTGASDRSVEGQSADLVLQGRDRLQRYQVAVRSSDG